MADDVQRRRAKRPRASHTPFNEEIGRRVRALRVLAGKSQAELGRMLGLTFQQVQKYERGSNRISVENLWQLAQIFDVDIAFFFDGVPERQRHAQSGRPRGSSRLRLEIARDLQKIESDKLLRGILTLVRAVAPDEVIQQPAAQESVH
jgi:transcriptional regulator with XRE-family HTH domain